MNNFENILQLVISKLEGGYFHRDMLTDGRLKDPNGLYSAGEGRKDSGETMFGIDRVNGAPSLSKSIYWNQFWKIIDEANARKLWKWNYKGGNLEEKLTALAAKIMLPEFNKLSKSYLTSKALNIVFASQPLAFHFAYATWNGAGFFKSFASKINDAVTKGIKEDGLIEIAKNSRSGSSNSLIRKSSEKISEIMDSIYKNKFPIVLVLVLITASVLLFLYLNKNKLTV